MSNRIGNAAGGSSGGRVRRAPGAIDRLLSAVDGAGTARLLGIIFLVAVVARLFFFFAVFEPLKDRYGWMGDDSYDEIAMNLLAGNGYVEKAGEPPNTVRMPLYTGLLVLQFMLFGTGRLSLVLMQSLLQAGACGLLFGLSRRHFGDRRVAFLSALGLALYPQSMLYASQYLTESLYLPMAVAAAALFFAITTGRSAGSALLLGALLGLLTLCKPVSQFLIVPVCLAILYRFRGRRREGLSCAGKVLLTFLLVLSPWTVRNYVVTGDFIPVSTRGGRFLYSNTIAAPEEEKGALALLEQEAIERPGEEEAKWFELAAANILRNPGRFLGNTLQTTLDFWYRGHSRLVSVVNGLINFPLLLLGIVGLWRARRRGIAVYPAVVLLLYYNGVYGMLHAIARYALPVIPILLMFGAFALLGSRGREDAGKERAAWS